MSKKYEEFEKDLINLCNLHGVQLAPGSYDFIEVHDKEEKEEAIHPDSLMDRTEQTT